MSFVNIYSKNITGMMTFTANTLGLNGNCSLFSNYNVGCLGPGTSSYDGAWITTDKNSYASSTWHTFVQNLPQSSTLGGTTYDYTQNSSSGVLTIPTNVTIDYAVLIWSGNWGLDANIDALSRDCSLTTPLGNTVSITPSYGLTSSEVSNNHDKFYTCAADVTSIIEAADSGTYTVGNVYSEFGPNSSAAGWSLLVVYEDSTVPFLNISINLSNVYVDAQTPDYGTLTGFMAPESPYTISAGAIITALHGDSNTPGDSISVSNSSDTFTALSGTYNPAGNFFGGQIENPSGLIDTLGTFGDLNAQVGVIETRPGRRNAFDLAFVDLSPALSHSQTSATVASETTGNTYYLSSFTSIILDATAQIQVSSSASKSIVNIGDSYNISYTITNDGSKATDSINFTFEHLDGLNFISGSYTDPSLSGITHDITQSPDNLTLPDIGINESIIISLNYQASKVPDILMYDNLGSVYYTTTAATDNVSNTVTTTTLVNINFTGNITADDTDPVSITTPMVNPSSSNLTYAISTQPVYGSLSVSSQGIITYTAYTLMEGTDMFVVLVRDTLTGKTMNLVYDVNLIITPDLSITYTEVPSTVTLNNQATFVYTLTNNNDNHPITNVVINPYPATGFMFNSSSYTNGGLTYDLPHTVNNYYPGDIEASQTTIVRMIYTALEIPTDLFYQNSTTVYYSFGGKTYNTSATSPEVLINAVINISMYNTEQYNKSVPITQPTYMYLTYSLVTQGSIGTASINSSGVITYTPNTGVIGTDTVVIRATNTQTSNTVDITYYFDIHQVINPPINVTLADELLYFLENDLFLGAIKSNNIDANVCFDCNLWNNGYTFNGNTIIPPIKTTFNTLLTSVKLETQSYINTSLCNDYGLSAQLDRFLSIINDLQNKINAILCNNSCCNESLSAQLLNLSIQTIEDLIPIVATIEGLDIQCSMNCSCNSPYNLIVGSLVNDISILSNIMPNWNSIVLAFMSCTMSTPKPYVPAYMPNQPIQVPTPPKNMNFYCGPNNCR